MLLLTTSLSTGWRSAIPISIGITLAKIVLLIGAFFGLNLLLASAPQVFVILKIFGCAFLLWRAYKLWRTSAATVSETKNGFWQSLSLAFTVGVSNPQALLFYVAVVPQVSQSTNPFVLCLIIAMGFTLISAFYAGMAQPIRAWILKGNNVVLLNRSVAVIFVVLAGIVAMRIG